VDPPFADGYFEYNPEEGNSPWGEKVAACNIRTGCRIDDGDPDVGPPPNAPALPAGSCNPVPPTAPAPSDAEAASALPARLGVNPHERGLTGLETWFWVNDASDHLSWTQTGSPGVDANCNQLPAATATCTAAVESWTFHLTGDHESATYASERPGTEDNPAANHTFEYVDFYQLELTAQLRGDVSGEVLLDQREYEVVEVRPHLTE
jgi:hypothetical protein